MKKYIIFISLLRENIGKSEECNGYRCRYYNNTYYKTFMVLQGKKMFSSLVQTRLRREFLFLKSNSYPVTHLRTDILTKLNDA